MAQNHYENCFRHFLDPLSVAQKNNRETFFLYHMVFYNLYVPLIHSRLDVLHSGQAVTALMGLPYTAKLSVQNKKVDF